MQTPDGDEDSCHLSALAGGEASQVQGRDSEEDVEPGLDCL
jgi:hypothetical protein